MKGIKIKEKPKFISETDIEETRVPIEHCDNFGMVLLPKTEFRRLRGFERKYRILQKKEVNPILNTLKDFLLVIATILATLLASQKDIPVELWIVVGLLIVAILIIYVSMYGIKLKK